MATIQQLSDAQPEDLLRRAFDAYNRQDADTLLTMVTADVRWPGDEGRMIGRDDLRAFWEDQWTRTRIHDEVTQIERLSDIEFSVSLDQMVRAVDGTKLSADSFRYGFVVADGRIAHLKSREPVVRNGTWAPNP